MALSQRSLLSLGVVAGPFYLALGVVQGLVRSGFDFGRHPLSVLANGPGGWVQTANFVLTGLMVITAAVGIRRALAPRGAATSVFLGGYGACMLVASVLRADPMDGFPAGTPLGPPTSITPIGMGHFIAGALGFILLAVSCFCGAGALSRRGARSLARLSFFSGLAVVLGFFGGPMLPTAAAMVLGIWFAVVVGWAWLAILCRHLLGATQ
jgi:hypothetical protein